MKERPFSEARVSLYVKLYCWLAVTVLLVRRAVSAGLLLMKTTRLVRSVVFETQVKLNESPAST